MTAKFIFLAIRHSVLVQKTCHFLEKFQNFTVVAAVSFRISDVLLQKKLTTTITVYQSPLRRHHYLDVAHPALRGSEGLDFAGRSV
jgi:hypothetical protein